MEKTFDLTLEQRYGIIRYIYRIPCTITVRLTIDGFIDKLLLSDSEIAEGLSVEYVDGVAKASDPSYVRSYAPSELQPTLGEVRAYIKYLDEVISEGTEGGANAAREIRAALLPLFPNMQTPVESN